MPKFKKNDVVQFTEDNKWVASLGIVSEVTCQNCKFKYNCPVLYSYNNAACLTLRKKDDGIQTDINDYEVNVLKSISETMTCDKCPYPCKAKEKSSLANCVANWAEILSQIDSDVDWKEVRHMVSERFNVTS